VLRLKHREDDAPADDEGHGRCSSTPPADAATKSPDDVGQRIYALAAELYPICRSITGDGVRRSLELVARHIPICRTEVPTGTQVFDWTIPREWNINDAYIETENGDRVLDFSAHNLHVLNYSTPVRAKVSLNELKAHVYALPDQPDLIPYRTSYYEERWGFCLSQNALDALPEGTYTAVIDSTLSDGHLTYGEHVIYGASEDEVVLSAHICHPSLANDNCSGVALLAMLAQELARHQTRYTYRCLFAPGTIGAITWLAVNEGRVGRIKHGLVLSCVGDAGGPTYKKSRRGDALIDRAMTHVLLHAAPHATILDFSPYGYDERQYCSPGFNLPVGLFQRSLHGTFPEYHTSADNLDFIAPKHLAHSYDIVRSVIEVIETDRVLVNTNPKCEPALGRRGLYASVNTDPDAAKKNMAMLWVLNLCDGSHSLLDIAEQSNIPFSRIADAAARLENEGLLVCQAVAASCFRAGHERSRSEMMETGRGHLIPRAGSS
jgi:aminopeptidase-like protein